MKNSPAYRYVPVTDETHHSDTTAIDSDSEDSHEPVTVGKKRPNGRKRTIFIASLCMFAVLAVKVTFCKVRKALKAGGVIDAPRLFEWIPEDETFDINHPTKTIINEAGESFSILEMPHIAYPAGATFDHADLDETCVSGRGGWETKFEVTLTGLGETSTNEDSSSFPPLQDDEERFMFKPAHGPMIIPGGWMIRFDKGLLHYQEDRPVPSLLLNELTAYELDQLLQLNRVPTVVPYGLDSREVHNALEHTLGAHHTFLRTKMNLKPDSWKKWTITPDSSSVVGTLQYMLLDVVKPTKHSWLRLQTRPDLSTYYSRELSTRRVFDYLLANVDRGNNNFVHPPELSDNYDVPPALVYIDQNWLTTVGFDVESLFDIITSPESPSADNCRLYYDPIAILQNVGSLWDVLAGRLQDQYPLVQGWVDTDQLFSIPDDLNVLSDIDHRLEMVLDYVDRCVDEYGFYHVYTDAGN